MKKILISSFDMEVGGVERSLISMLDYFDYNQYDVDLMLCRHQGEFLKFIPQGPTLLNEIPAYATFRKSIKEIIKEKKYMIGLARLRAKIGADRNAKLKQIKEPGYIQMQLMWKYALPFLPQLQVEYDVAISYLWPHYFVADKVKAKKKIAWIHTDYATITTDKELDLQMWDKFDAIFAVSDGCRQSFLKTYPSLKDKVYVMENVISKSFILQQAEEEIEKEFIENTNLKLLTVARLSHAKGIDQAVRAMKVLKDKGIRNITWYVIGYGGDEQIIQQLIKELGVEEEFVLLGKKINPYPYMKYCQLYVQPSRYEGKAVTVVEAQTLGKPVLITNYPTAHSQVTHGVDGYITELSVEGIADGIEKLINNQSLRETIASHAKQSNQGSYKSIESLYTMMNG